MNGPVKQFLTELADRFNPTHEEWADEEFPDCVSSGVYAIGNPEDTAYIAHGFATNRLALRARQLLEDAAPESWIDIVFDGPPAHESGRFIEVEDPTGASVGVGEWIDRGDGFLVLRLPWKWDS